MFEHESFEIGKNFEERGDLLELFRRCCTLCPSGLLFKMEQICGGQKSIGP